VAHSGAAESTLKEYDEDGMFSAECPAIPGSISQGETFPEAEMNIRDAIRQCREVRAEKLLPIPAVARQVEVTVSCCRFRY
jgi:predicted RNase H-like HicB family nuclease